MDPERIVSNVIRILGLKIKTGLQHITLYLVAGYHIKKDLYNIPLLRVLRKTVVQRKDRMHFMELIKQ
jgi:hypothetical protein